MPSRVLVSPRVNESVGAVIVETAIGRFTQPVVAFGDKLIPFMVDHPILQLPDNIEVDYWTAAAWPSSDWGDDDADVMLWAVDRTAVAIQAAPAPTPGGTAEFVFLVVHLATNGADTMINSIGYQVMLWLSGPLFAADPLLPNKLLIA
jgi:hypothetical protein